MTELDRLTWRSSWPFISAEKSWVNRAIEICSVGRLTEDLIWRSWVRFPTRSKDFFLTSCGSLIPFTRANAQWVIHGFNLHFNLHFRVNSTIRVHNAARHNIHLTFGPTDFTIMNFKTNWCFTTHVWINCSQEMITDDRHLGRKLRLCRNTL